MITKHTLPYTVSDMPDGTLRVAVRAFMKDERNMRSITCCVCDVPNITHIPRGIALAIEGSRMGLLKVEYENSHTAITGRTKL